MNLHNRLLHRIANPAPLPGCRLIQPGHSAQSTGLACRVVENSPIEAAAFVENVAYGSDGTTRVDLGCDWPAMLDGLCELGELLVITRNESAVIAKRMPYPMLHHDSQDDLAVDDSGDFDVDFDAWSSAFARHERTENGNVFKVEFLDAAQHAFHAVVLTPDASVDAFTEWVRMHQARISWKRRKCTCRLPESELAFVEGTGDLKVKANALLPLLEVVVHEKLPIRAIVGNAGMVQGHRYTPKNVRQTGTRIYCSSDTTALHFETRDIDRVTAQSVELGNHPCWILRAHRPDGRPLFLIAPTTCASLPTWNKLVLAHAI
ncbi:MAG TPA: ChuX/HutX family heme-like substrate-binding protein [Chthoniobacterales bacterium]